METKESHSEQQARAQLESIKEMVAALECDYDRLEDLTDEREALVDAIESAEGEEKDTEQIALNEWDEANGDELKELKEAAGDCESREEADERIHDDPLEVQVRSDWHEPGAEADKPTEFYILLCTGGPAVRLIGELNQYSEPSRCRLEHQDWGTTWQELITTGSDHEALLTYARCFYFGE